MGGWQIEGFDLAQFVRATLDEDLGLGLPGGGHDVTSESVIPADMRFSGVMDSRDGIVVAGLPIAAAFFRALDPRMEIEVLVEEGASVPAGSDLMRLSGNARAMLTAERSALNTVQHLSGIATMTRAYVDAMQGHATLLDTRKTIPGLRHLEKYATRMGGAKNHRHGAVGRGDDQGQPCARRRRGRRGGAPRPRRRGQGHHLRGRPDRTDRTGSRQPGQATCCSTT